MKKSMIHHLDCTLRDGGYYNNWEFSHELVEKYLKTMSEININTIGNKIKAHYVLVWKTEDAKSEEEFNPQVSNQSIKGKTRNFTYTNVGATSTQIEKLKNL